jgi:hypothetical protein
MERIGSGLDLTYRLDNVPFYAYDLKFCDVVEAIADALTSFWATMKADWFGNADSEIDHWSERESRASSRSSILGGFAW